MSKAKLDRPNVANTMLVRVLRDSWSAAQV